MHEIESTYYRSTITFIQTTSLNIDPLELKNIYGELLDNNKKLQKWIASLSEQMADA